MTRIEAAKTQVDRTNEGLQNAVVYAIQAAITQPGKHVQIPEPYFARLQAALTACESADLELHNAYNQVELEFAREREAAKDRLIEQYGGRR
jgi:aspartate/methionine/tyrosine aminotransferase